MSDPDQKPEDEPRSTVGDPWPASQRDDWQDELDNQRRARSHFPHLSTQVLPRESDEHPTFWEQ